MNLAYNKVSFFELPSEIKPIMEIITITKIIEKKNFIKYVLSVVGAC